MNQLSRSKVYALDILAQLAMQATDPGTKDILWNAAFYLAGVGAVHRPSVPGYEIFDGVEVY